MLLSFCTGPSEITQPRETKSATHWLPVNHSLPAELRPPFTDLHIAALIEEENQIREKSSVSDDDAARLKHLNVQLDQCWDLLRQRRALREFGESAASATPRDVEIVESYKG